MKPFEIPFSQPEAILPGAQFSDCFAVSITGLSLNAVSATQRVLDRIPAWISGLRRLRNLIVAPLGLKTGLDKSIGPDKRIGTFPLVSKSPERVVVGLDDKHLDFRLVVDVINFEDGHQTVTATTFVKTHNAFGRFYLGVVKPFHRIIVPAMLAKVGG
jgi:Protein of unknown function (DUF2867)